MKSFILPMPEMVIGETEDRVIKDANKQPIGQKTIVTLMYLGGFVKVEVDKGFSASLKPGAVGTAFVSMEPSMSGRSVQDGKFAFIDTGFDNFKLVSFEPGVYNPTKGVTKL